MSFGGTIRLVPLKRLWMVSKIKLKNTNTKVYNNEAKLLLLSQKPSQCNLLNENIASMKSDEIPIIVIIAS